MLSIEIHSTKVTDRPIQAEIVIFPDDIGRILDILRLGT